MACLLINYVLLGEGAITNNN